LVLILLIASFFWFWSFFEINFFFSFII
jgi:hypothetical protein